MEERLRKAVNESSMTGTQLANYAFNPQTGPLAKHLGRNQAEREGLRELYSGAFKLFRNPTAHGVVGYSSAEGKAIVGLVDLLLKMLRRVEELPPSDFFPDNLEAALEASEDIIGPGATSRLRMFLGKCVTGAGLQPSESAQSWIGFKQYALYQADHWSEPRSHPIALFYFAADERKNGLQFSTEYCRRVAGFEKDHLVDELTELGFRPFGKNQEPRVDLQIHNDQKFFDNLFLVVKRAVDELKETLSQV
jgi:hypothetical protein